MIKRFPQYCPHIPRGGIVRRMPISAFQVLGNEDVRDEAGTEAGLRDHLRRQGRDDGRVRAGRAGVHRAHQVQHVQLTRHAFQLFGDFFAKAHQPRLLLLGQIDDFAHDAQTLRFRVAPAAFLLGCAGRASSRLGDQHADLTLIEHPEQQALRLVELFIFRPVNASQKILKFVIGFRAAQLLDFQQRFELPLTRVLSASVSSIGVVVSTFHVRVQLDAARAQ